MKQAVEREKMNKKLIAIGATALFFTLLFTPQVLAIEKEEKPLVPSYIYMSANITGEIELQDSIYPIPSILNPILINFGALLRVEATLIEGTIVPNYPLLKSGLRNVTVPNEEVSHANLVMFLFKGTIEPIPDKTTYNIEGKVFYLVANLVAAE
jgi:hypothetical protein